MPIVRGGLLRIHAPEARGPGTMRTTLRSHPCPLVRSRQPPPSVPPAAVAAGAQRNRRRLAVVVVFAEFAGPRAGADGAVRVRVWRAVGDLLVVELLVASVAAKVPTAGWATTVATVRGPVFAVIVIEGHDTKVPAMPPRNRQPAESPRSGKVVTLTGGGTRSGSTRSRCRVAGVRPQAPPTARCCLRSVPRLFLMLPQRRSATGCVPARRMTADRR